MSENNIINIEKNTPHLVIDSIGGGQHVIPVSFFEDVRNGRQSLKNLEDFESIVPVIINEWMLSKNI